MKKLGIFYGSTTGQTARVAERLGELLACREVHDVAAAAPGDLRDYEVLVLGTSTWGVGELQDDWAGFDLSRVDLSGKKVALFGLGDALGFGDSFVDGMGILYDAVVARGASVIARWPGNGYGHGQSAAEIDGSFVGLALDNENQAERTAGRLAEWVELIKSQS